MDATTVTQALLDAHAIQLAYFPHRGPAYFHARAGRNRVRWAFTFQDLGMTHTIRGRTTVEARDGFVTVNNHRVESAQEAADRAFKGRYQRYLRGMYAKLGITGTLYL